MGPIPAGTIQLHPHAALRHRQYSAASPDSANDTPSPTGVNARTVCSPGTYPSGAVHSGHDDASKSTSRPQRSHPNRPIRATISPL